MAQYTGKKLEIATDYICNYIQNNHLAQGDRLPTEKQLVEDTGLSRITLRRALSNLQEKGMISSIQGSGYFVGSSYQAIKTDSLPMVVSYGHNSSRILDMVQGAQVFLDSVHCRLNVTVTGRNPNNEKEAIEELYRTGARCAIVLPVSSEDNCDFYFHMIQSGIEFGFCRPQALRHYLLRSCPVRQHDWRISDHQASYRTGTHAYCGFRARTAYTHFHHRRTVRRISLRDVGTRSSPSGKVLFLCTISTPLPGYR